MKIYVPGYQSIHMLFTVMHAKFDCGLSISIVQIFNVQTPPSEERTDNGKSLTLLTLIFLVN
jgi:hypothetical protein